VVAGPSGVGKGTVLAQLREREPGLWFSVSATTREMRPGEIDGVDYRFLSRDDFVAQRDDGRFLEWFDVYGDLKGTPRQPVEEHLAAGDDVLLEVDVQGALRVREEMPDAVLVFLDAPTPEAQAERLRARGVDAPDQIDRRLAEADIEKAVAERFDEVVVNDDADRAARQLAAILAARRHRGATD